MEAKPGPPEQGPAPDPEASVERYGPLELRRLRKDDGRRLIVYRRVEPAEDSPREQ
jgi:hypothetical protein